MLWKHVFTIFIKQKMCLVSCFRVWKKKLCLVCVCVFLKKLTNVPLGWNWKMKLYVLSNQVGPIFFKIFTKVPLSNVVWNLKTSNIPQTLLKKHPYQIRFFLELQFSVFKHWKLLFETIYQTGPVLLSKKMPKHMISSRSSIRDNRLRSIRI